MIEVQCVSADLHPSPKEEDCVVQYRFRQAQVPQGKPGDLFLDGMLATYIRPSQQIRFAVGERYHLKIEVQVVSK